MGMFDDYSASIEAMKAASAKSGLVGIRPLLFDTSDFRPGDGPWHGWQMASDWGNDADQWQGSKQMDEHAIWLESNYGPHSLEIIHCFSGGGSYLDGIYWKNGQKVTGDYFSEAECNRHRGHNHWAITNTALAMVDPVVPILPKLTDAERKQIAFLQKVVLRMPADLQTGYWGPKTDTAWQTLRWASLMNDQGFIASSTLPGVKPVKAQPSSQVKEAQRALFHFSAGDQTGLWGPKTDAAMNLARLCWKDK